MPNPDYSKSCIYMLRHKDDTELENIYIGSTTNFRLRKNQHKTCCCNPKCERYNLKKYQYIRANGGWNEWKMVWLEDYPCNNVRELHLREDEVMLKYQNRLNHHRASRTKKQYAEDNKDRLAEYKKEHRKNNKEYILDRDREYKKKNRDILNDKAREYYQSKKEILSKKIKCDICGCEIRNSYLKKHQETKKCQSHLTNS